MRLVWATRGRTWGFRFLLTGGLNDPLDMYDEVFSGFEGQPEVCSRIAEKVALRFPDPLAREDAAGRVIPHEFVIVWPRPWTDGIDSTVDGLRLIWPLVADEFSRVWSMREPPSALG